MDTVLSINESQVDNLVSEAVQKVFETMMQTDTEHLQSGPHGPIPLPENEAVIAGNIGFVGAVNGVFYLFFQQPTAYRLTELFLGLDEGEAQSEPEETICDSLGEMCNMIAGTFKNQLCDLGYNCRLTLPSILKGKDMAVQTNANALRRQYRFQAIGQTFVAEIFIKPGE